MSSYVQMLVHLVWSVKGRQKVLDDEVRPLLFKHISNNAKRKGIKIIEIGGYTDHIHVLLRLESDQMLCNVVKQIKGESSHWINHKLDSLGKPDRFRWTHRYFAQSVADFQADRLIAYIQNQEKHHQSRDFSSELDLLLKRMKRY